MEHLHLKQTVIDLNKAFLLLPLHHLLDLLMYLLFEVPIPHLLVDGMHLDQTLNLEEVEVEDHGLAVVAEVLKLD